MSFSDDIRKANENIMDDFDEYRKGVSIKLFNSVIDDTPVVSGRLRGNWQTSEGQPKTDKIEDVRPKGTPEAEATNVVQSSTRDTTIYLTNNLPYAVSVETKRAMLRKNVARITQILREQVKK